MLTDASLRDLLVVGYETAEADFVVHYQTHMSRTVYLMAQLLAERREYTYMSSIDLQRDLNEDLRTAGITRPLKGFNPVDWFSAQWTLAVDDLANTAHFAENFNTDWENADPTRFPARIKAAATALLNVGCKGKFEISHSSGSLTIRTL